VHKDFLNAKELRPVGVLGIMWGDLADLTVGADRFDLIAAPIFLLVFIIASSIILRGPIQYI
jgi:hypothetical protein